MVQAGEGWWGAPRAEQEARQLPFPFPLPCKLPPITFSPTFPVALTPTFPVALTLPLPLPLTLTLSLTRSPPGATIASSHSSNCS